MSVVRSSGATRHAFDLYLRLAVFLARHPDEVLTAEDISKKFDCSFKNVYSNLRRSVQSGLLDCAPLMPGTKRPLAYRAGPALLGMLGPIPIESDLCRGIFTVLLDGGVRRMIGELRPMAEGMTILETMQDC